MERKERSRLVKTPKHHIPIGEAIKDDNGFYSVRIKKPGAKEVEVISLDRLNRMIMEQAD